MITRKSFLRNNSVLLLFRFCPCRKESATGNKSEEKEECALWTFSPHGSALPPGGTLGLMTRKGLHAHGTP